MERRRFLQVVGIGGLATLTLPGLSGCRTTADGGNILVTNQSADGRVLYGTSRSPRAWLSTNQGRSWQMIDLGRIVGARGILGIWPLDDGELLAAVDTRSDTVEPGALWRSVGYPRDGVACQWERTLQMGYLGDVGKPAPTAPGGIQTGLVAPQRAWTVDVHGSIVVTCEYGRQLAGDKSRYVYLSEDMGRSFVRVFDIGGESGQHTHGVCYDPWWDALWLTSGDGYFRGLHVSFDRGASWASVPLNANGVQFQFVGVAALERCIVLTSDYQDFNGVARIPRPLNGSRNPSSLVVERAWTYSVHTGRIDMVGSTMYQSPKRGAPLIMAFEAQSQAPSMVVATRDGYQFDQLWREDRHLDVDQTGASTAIGPDAQGTVYVSTLADGRYPSTGLDTMRYPYDAVPLWP